MLHVTGFQTERVAVLGSDLSKNASMQKGGQLVKCVWCPGAVPAEHVLVRNPQHHHGVQRKALSKKWGKVAESCTWSFIATLGQASENCSHQLPVADTTT